MTITKPLTFYAGDQPQLTDSYSNLLKVACATDEGELLYFSSTESLIKRDACIHAVVDENDKVLSACSTTQREGTSFFDLTGMITDPEARGHGYGADVVEKAIMSSQARGAEWLFLVVRVWHGKVCFCPDRLYRRLGFHATGHFHFSKITDHEMCRHLTPDHHGGYLSLEYVREIPAMQEVG